ncbi:hypothetical protein AXF42_Ash001762 [Apostasia shenzhenica]|uniref:Uncharacterized protein n=1 Tax=Apostasia shenzhenica TaxID=1088818 RepID=A0A2I0AB54_9ASPA|nr:hypothetical protein AXF42_Ash001762 [Apostasia shenzhenica]
MGRDWVPISQTIYPLIQIPHMKSSMLQIVVSTAKHLNSMDVSIQNFVTGRDAVKELWETLQAIYSSLNDFSRMCIMEVLEPQLLNLKLLGLHDHFLRSVLPRVYTDYFVSNYNRTVLWRPILLGRWSVEAIKFMMDPEPSDPLINGQMCNERNYCIQMEHHADANQMPPRVQYRWIRVHVAASDLHPDDAPFGCRASLIKSTSE